MAARSIANSRAIVTGASSGIGQAVAFELARQGAHLVITARREDRLLAVAQQITAFGRRVSTVVGDITDAHVRDELIAAAQQQLGGLDLLINNAGIGAIGPFADADEDRLRRVMEVNFFAPAELARAALPLLKCGRNPIIANVGSVLGHVAVPDKSEYCASKFALHGLTDAWREEFAADGIDVLLVSPSTTASEFFDRAIVKPNGKRTVAGPFRMTPQKVARRIVRGLRLGKREIILPFSGRALVWSDRLFPGVVSWLLRKRRS